MRGEAIAQAFTDGLNERLRIGMQATNFGATFSALDEEMQRLEEISKARAAQIASNSQDAIRQLTNQDFTPATRGGATFSALSDAEEKREKLRRRMNELLERAQPLLQAELRYNQDLEDIEQARLTGLIKQAQIWTCRPTPRTGCRSFKTPMRPVAVVSIAPT